MNENVPLHTSNAKTKSEIEWLISLLPPTNSLANPKGLEATYYGASHTIAWQLGLKEAPTQSLTSWTHRWYHQPLDFPRNLACWADPKYPVLVATEKQADFLRNGGFPYSIAVGAPFVYQPHLGLPRKEGTLLVMPPHTNDDQEHDLDQEGWGEYLISLRPRFKQIVACVHRACVGRYWTTVLDQIGIPWVCGAHTLDMNSQIRMRVLFESFEFVNSSIIGSQVAYAAYAGARPSISGPYLKTPPEALAKAPFFAAFPYLHMPNEIAHSRERVERDFPFICNEPEKIPDLTAWGAEMLGESFKRPCEEVARLLGWQYNPEEPLCPVSSFSELGPKLGWRDSYELTTHQTTVNDLQGKISSLQAEQSVPNEKLTILLATINTLQAKLDARTETEKPLEILWRSIQLPQPSWWEKFVCNLLPKSTVEKARERQWEEDIRYLQDPRFFDRAAYLEHSPDVAVAGLDPIEHFVRNGEEEERKPHPFYDAKYHCPKAIAYRKQPYAGSYYVALLRWIEKHDLAGPHRT